MSSEVSIAKPLSGPECVEACLAALRKAISRDDRFSSHMAYSGFRAEINLKFYPVLSFIPPVDRDVVLEEGDVEGVETEPTVELTAVLEPAPPNKVREDAEMPQPVLVTEQDGKSHEKWVRKGAVPRQNRIPGKLKVMGA